MDMPIQRMKANPLVESCKGRFTLMRGPIVYCFEGSDNAGHVQNIVIPDSNNFTDEYLNNLLGGVTVLKGSGTAY
jgi:uncharacterized protein